MVTNAMAAGDRIVYTDEANFSCNYFMDRGWSRRNLPLLLKQYLFETKPIYVVAAMSKEFGLEALHVYDWSIKSGNFIKILTDLTANGRRFVVAGDNVSYHDSKEARRSYEKRNTYFIGLVQG